VLAEYSLVMRCGRYAWQIASTAKQLPLAMQLPNGQAAADSEFFGATPSESGHPDGTPESPKKRGKVPESLTGKRVIFDGTPEKPESDPGKTGVPRSSSSGLIDLDINPKVKPLPRADTGKTGVPPAELLVILDEHGIREPARSRLAGLAHVTARLLRYHLWTAPTPALAIYRIGANWRVPRDWEYYTLPEPVEEPGADALEAETPEEAEKLFRGALAILKMCAGGGEYAALAKLQARGFDGRVLTLEAENQAQVEAARRAERALLAAMGREVEVEITT
jgi:hypothetical protein